MSSARRTWEAAAAKAAPVLGRGLGVRLGETAVVSRRLHTLVPGLPGEVQIVSAADAGLVFYGRPKPDQVVHLDIFHDVGQVDHRMVGRACVAAADGFGRLGLRDLVDVQTGTGGGRASGLLAYGTKESLRRAHLNHVHLAVMLDDADLVFLFYLVSAVEQAISSQGLSLRCVDLIRNETSTSAGQPADLSPYASFTDSFLKGQGRGPWNVTPSPAPGEEADRSAGHDSGTAGGSGGAGGAGDTDGLDGGGGSQKRLGREAANDARMLQLANSLVEDFASLEDARAYLEALGQGKGWGELKPELARLGPAPGALPKLKRRGLVNDGFHGPSLTPSGLALAEYLRRRHREVEMRLRAMARSVPISGGTLARGHRAAARATRLGPDVGAAAVRAVPESRCRLRGDIAVPETVLAAAKRCHFERSALHIGVPDLHFYERKRSQPIDLCLVIDASASMAGRRLKAAQFLATQLLLSTRDRVAVVVFQERDSFLWLPFTRDYSRAENSLRRVQALGLTPLAHGLDTSLNYLLQSKAANPLMVLITDGIPTVPKWSADPMRDARDAAGTIAANRVQFACIGLEPNRLFLEGLAREARGTLYILDELEKDKMVQIVAQERFKRLEVAREGKGHEDHPWRPPNISPACPGGGACSGGPVLDLLR